ncbi:hypothetical protein OSJ04_25555, partial [Mycobacterium ulcerans]
GACAAAGIGLAALAAGSADAQQFSTAAAGPAIPPVAVAGDPAGAAATTVTASPDVGGSPGAPVAAGAPRPAEQPGMAADSTSATIKRSVPTGTAMAATGTDDTGQHPAGPAGSSHTASPAVGKSASAAYSATAQQSAGATGSAAPAIPGAREPAGSAG